MCLQSPSLKRQRLRKLVCYFEPGQRQQLTIFDAQAYGNGLAEECAAFLQIPLIKQPAKAKAIPQFWNDGQNQRQETSDKDKWLPHQKAAKKQYQCHQIPGAARTPPLSREPGWLLNIFRAARTHLLPGRLNPATREPHRSPLPLTGHMPLACILCPCTSEEKLLDWHRH